MFVHMTSNASMQTAHCRQHAHRQICYQVGFFVRGLFISNISIFFVGVAFCDVDGVWRANGTVIVDPLVNVLNATSTVVEVIGSINITGGVSVNEGTQINVTGMLYFLYKICKTQKSYYFLFSTETVTFGGPIILTLINASLLPTPGGTVELILINYGNYTGLFVDNITLLLPARGGNTTLDTCERLSAEPRYTARSFSVVLISDQSECEKAGNKQRLSALDIIAIVVSIFVLFIAVGVVVMILLLCPDILHRKPPKLRARTRTHINHIFEV